MVLDGSVDPASDIVSRTRDDARSKQQRLDYFIASCEFGNVQCPVSNIRTCINDVKDMVDYIGDEFDAWLAPVQGLLEMLGINANSGVVMLIIVQVLFSAYDEMSVLCDVSNRRDTDSFKDWIIKNLIGNNPEELMTTAFPIINATDANNVIHSFEYNTASKPTSGQSPDADWPFKGYGLFTLTSVAQDMITAQDMAFGSYDEDGYVNFFQGINADYSGAGTQLPARSVQQWYSSTYYWPNSTPLPPIGNPNLKGIVAGQLFDPATPYIWTQVSYIISIDPIIVNCTL